MLSPLFYRFYQLAAVVFFLFGATLLILDDWSAQEFPWTVTPFVTATWGAWWIGAAVYAWEVTRVRRVAELSPCLIHLWLFPLLEAGVIVYYNYSYQLDEILSAPYLIVLVLSLIGFGIGITDLIRCRPSLRDQGRAVPIVARVLTLAFVAAVMLLGVKGLTLKAGGYGTEAKIFPDPLRLISARTFGAFYTAVSLSAVPVLLARSVAPMLTLARTGLVVIVLILVAALIHLDRFDFVNRPGGLLYLGAYVGVGGVTGIIILWYGSPLAALGIKAASSATPHAAEDVLTSSESSQATAPPAP